MEQLLTRSGCLDLSTSMVLFHNINLGQKVGVNLGWSEVRGTVSYKGALSGKQGDWVGVTLEEKGKGVMFVKSDACIAYFLG